MPPFAAAIHCILGRAPYPAPDPDLPQWQQRLRAIALEWPDPAARALVAGAEAPCVAFAFAAGYQAALERMLGPAPGNPFRALCVTEREGNRPRNIHATLRAADDGWRLSGEKTYVTGGAHAQLLCIAALQPVLAELETAWQDADPAFHASWQRDRCLLGVAAAARTARTARAWEHFASSRTPPG